jgi:DedD protein
MAIPISEEELQLKKRARRRLIGAIALVTVVAVFLPMVLDHEPKPVSQDISIQIPSQNAGTFTSKIVPVVPGSAESAATSAPDAPAVAPPAPSKVTIAPAIPVTPPVARDSEAAPVKAAGAESKSAAPEPKPKAKPPQVTDTEAAPVNAAVSEAKPKAKPKVKPATKADGRDNGSFVVQVAALTDADKARQMREQIAAAGVKAYTEVVPTTKGDVTRVRAGPFATREAAEKARVTLKDMGLAGNVVSK